MNVEQQQHLPPPPPSLLTTELYGSGTPPTSGSDLLQASSIATTYVTINMMAPPPLTHAATTTSMPLAMTSAATTTTSTFKSSLLPMPSLEDIEGGMPMAASGAPQQQQPIPGGILKYPTTAATIPISLPIDMGPGPPPMSMYMQPPTPQLGDTVTGLPQPSSSAANNHPPQPPPPAPTSLAGSTGSEATLLLSTPPPQSMPLPLPMSLPMSMPQATMGSTVVPMSSHTINSSPPNVASAMQTTSLASGRTPAHSSATMAGQNKAAAAAAAATATTTKCCGCFGAGRRNDTNSSASAEAAANKLNKKRKHKRQTMCSALLTNLGICALLLAYTLLGSFIFLTIESEDTSALLLQQHHQRTLASTKRAGQLGRAKAAHPSDINHNSNNNHINNNNMYQHQSTHQQQQHQGAYQHHHPDNGTIAAMASATGFAASEVPHSVVNNDFDYGGYGNGVDGGDDDDEASTQAELAISADTYDVRQQTIENIWDITVSLNILYKENWTKLAALEIAKFQDQLIKRLNEDTLLQLSHAMDGLHGDGDGLMQNGGGGQSPATEAVLLHAYGHHGGSMDWDFAKAFLYSLTVLTTIGYGNIAPRTTLGRLITLVYALFGIPLTLVYLSSTGGILAKIAREVFSKALCCCLCSNCGYCCYDEKRMAERERRLKRKRQQEEMRKQQVSMQEPYYVRSPTGPLDSGSAAAASFQTPEKHGSATPVAPPPPDIDSLSASESRGSMHGLSILAPILLCLCMMVIYIGFGAVVLYRLENWPLLDGVYFCFMSLSTIGFGDMVPGLRRESNTTTWFCSIYIMSGMALTAMCFNVIHEEIVHRIKIVVEFKKSPVLDMAETAEPAFYAAAAP